MPFTSSTLGFIEHARPRAVVVATPACSLPERAASVPARERLVCGAAMTVVVGSTLGTLLWFVVTFDERV